MAAAADTKSDKEGKVIPGKGALGRQPCFLELYNILCLLQVPVAYPVTCCTDNYRKPETASQSIAALSRTALIILFQRHVAISNHEQPICTPC